MSIGLNRSYQYAGLNRAGKYLETAREKGPALPEGRGQTAEGRVNEIWRRVSGIYPHVNLSVEERRAGLGRLAAWIEFKIQNAKRKIDGEIPGSAGVSPALIGAADLARMEGASHQT